MEDSAALCQFAARPAPSAAVENQGEIMDFNGKVAIVTGGAAGIAIALEGPDVVGVVGNGELELAVATVRVSD